MRGEEEGGFGELGLELGGEEGELGGGKGRDVRWAGRRHRTREWHGAGFWEDCVVFSRWRGGRGGESLYSGGAPHEASSGKGSRFVSLRPSPFRPDIPELIMTLKHREVKDSFSEHQIAPSLRGTMPLPAEQRITSAFPPLAEVDWTRAASSGTRLPKFAYVTDFRGKVIRGVNTTHLHLSPHVSS